MATAGGTRDAELEALWPTLSGRLGERGAMLLCGDGDGCRVVACRADDWRSFLSALETAAAGAARALGLGHGDVAACSARVREAALTELVETLAWRLEAELFTPEVNDDDVPY